MLVQVDLQVLLARLGYRVLPDLRALEVQVRRSSVAREQLDRRAPWGHLGYLERPDYPDLPDGLARRVPLDCRV